MMNQVKVKKVGYSSSGNCIMIEYEKEPGFDAYAAVAEKLSVKEGDNVWLLRNDQLNYKGFSAVAVLQA